MKRKAVIFVLICAIMTAAVFTGCGAGEAEGNATDSSGKTDATGSSGKTETGATASGKAGEASAQNGQASGDSSASEIPDTNESAVAWDNAQPSEPGQASTEQGSASSFSQVLVDRDDLYFAIKEVRKDNIYGCVMKVYIENRTEKNLMFSFEKTSVNGVMCDPFWAEVINAGKKGNCEITWMRDAFEQRRIEEVTEISFTLNVYNDEDYTEPVLMHDPFTIYPLGEERAAQAGYVPAPSDPEQILVDNEQCTVMILGYDPDNSWGYALNLYLVNKSDEDLMFSVENSSVNGIMCDPFWAEIVVSGKSSFSTILWDQTALADNDITEVKEISLPMRVYSDQDYADAYVDETFELAPSAK